MLAFRLMRKHIAIAVVVFAVATALYVGTQPIVLTGMRSGGPPPVPVALP